MDTELLSSLTKHWKIPGGIACRFDADSVSFHPWGARDIQSREAVTEQTRFPIASVTKTFTADLLLRCIRARKLRLQTPLKRILPEFSLAFAPSTQQMTLEDALCHFSGLPPHTWAWVYGDVDRKTFIRDRLPFLETLGPHRNFHKYSNILYAVLGQVIEELSGKAWEQSLQEEILRPLGLSDTVCLTESWAEQTPHLAAPHDAQGNPTPYFYAKENHLMAPASELMSTAADLVRWGQYLLTLPPDADRWRIRNKIREKRPFPAMGSLGYGLGWRIEHLQDQLRVWHSGQCSGYSSLLVLYPEQKTGGVYLCNRSGAVTALHGMDLVENEFIRPQDLPLPPPAQAAQTDPVVMRSCCRVVTENALPHQCPPPTPQPEANLQQGFYHNPGYGAIAIEYLNDVPHLKFQTASSVELLQDNEGRLWFEPPGYRQRFEVHHGANEVEIAFEELTAPIRFIKTES